MASKGSQSGKRDSSTDDSNKRDASARSGNAAQGAGSRGGSQASRTYSGSSGRKKESSTDR